MSTSLPSSTQARPQALKGLSWLSLSVAALVLGFTLAVALSLLVLLLSPGPLKPYNAKHQLGMWGIGGLWCLILPATFLLRPARRAWLVLGLANLLAYAALFLLRA